MVNYENMLYPQYSRKFDQTITAETWKWLQDQAAERLANDESAPVAAPAVAAHWRSIVDGTIPFGHHVKD